MTTIVIGYHEDTGAAIDGTVFFGVKNDREACLKALDWVAFAHNSVGGWRTWELRSSQEDVREIKPIDSDYK